MQVLGFRRAKTYTYLTAHIFSFCFSITYYLFYILNLKHTTADVYSVPKNNPATKNATMFSVYRRFIVSSTMSVPYFRLVFIALIVTYLTAGYRNATASLNVSGVR